MNIFLDKFFTSPKESEYSEILSASADQKDTQNSEKVPWEKKGKRQGAYSLCKELFLVSFVAGGRMARIGKKTISRGNKKQMLLKLKELGVPEKTECQSVTILINLAGPEFGS